MVGRQGGLGAPVAVEPRIGLSETEVRGREPAVAEQPRLELLHMRERRDLDRPGQCVGERLARGDARLGQLGAREEHLEVPSVCTKHDAEHGVGSRSDHGFRPTV